MTYGCQHQLWIGIAEATFIGAGYGGAEGGEEDDVIWVFLKDVFQSFLELGHKGGKWEELVLREYGRKVFMIIYYRCSIEWWSASPKKSFGIWLRFLLPAGFGPSQTPTVV